MIIMRHSLNLIYLAPLLRNVVRRLLQNMIRVKMLYVNLRHLCYCCIFSFVFRFSRCFLLLFLLIVFYHVMMNKMYISRHNVASQSHYKAPTSSYMLYATTNVHNTVPSTYLEHQIRLCAPSSIISRPTCFSSSLRCCYTIR